MNILIVDPSRSVHAFLRLILDDIAFEYQPNVERGLARLQAGGIDIVFFEWNQTNVDHLLQAEFPSLRKIALSFDANPEEMMCILLSGVHGFIKKPFTKKRFRDCITFHADQQNFLNPPRSSEPESKPLEMHLLFCEDDNDLREFIAAELQNIQGLNSEFASNGLDALNKAENQTYDAIITDIKMPGIDGMELITKIRQSPRNKHVPVFIFSGAAESKVSDFARDNLVTIFYKPFDMKSIIKGIQNKVFPNRTIATYHSNLVDYWYEVINEIFSANIGDFKFGTLEITELDKFDAYISTSVSLVGSAINGRIQLILDRAFSLDFVKEIFKDNFEREIGNIKDFVGELANQLAGRMKLKLEKHGVKLQITVPSTQFGETEVSRESKDSKVLLLHARSATGFCKLLLSMSKIGDDVFAHQVDGVVLDGGLFF